jgi:nanoRNase/pAp phosphatase (c-di-AMP/oligoRNAs hydrolase)
MGREAATSKNGFSGKLDIPLSHFLESHRGEKHFVVMQDYPDPDAISSAYTYQLIAQKFEIQADIYYGGKISHQENIALVRLLDIPLIIYQAGMGFEGYSGGVFVDNQGTTAAEIVEAMEEAQLPALAIVDHHEKQDRLQAEFTDLRRVGSTATIFTGYLQQGLLEMDRTNRQHVMLATALLHGIMTDTGDFSRSLPEDFKAAAYLSRYRDPDLLRNVITQSRSRSVMAVIHRALENRIVTESYSISGIGYLRGEDRDVIPQAADFLLAEENVHTAIVFGIVTDDERQEKLIGSMRTSKITLDPDAFIKDVLGKDVRGHYFGGGKLSAGGFEIPIGFLSGGELDDFQQKKWQVFEGQIMQKFFTKIGAPVPQNT